MTWNWQHSNWPRFRWDPRALAPLEAKLLRASGVVLGAAQHLDPAERERIVVQVMGDEALNTSAIEGEYLDRDSIQSSIRRQLGVLGSDKDDHGRVGPAERGVATMMVDLHRRGSAALDHETLFAWHRLLMLGRSDMRNAGCYRTHESPMQVVSGSVDAPKVHYEAPPSTRVPAEMDRLLDWYAHSAPTGPSPLPPLTRASIAHLHFVAIHPFEDGNGRLGRALAELCLAQSLGQPTLAAISTIIEKRRKDYYRHLAATNHSLDISAWVTWFGEVVLEAIEHSRRLVVFVIHKARLLQRLEGHINERQQKTLLRLFRAGPDGFEGGLSAHNHMTITGASRATATRDLADLVDKGALSRTGQRRHARYQLDLSDSSDGG